MNTFSQVVALGAVVGSAFGIGYVYGHAKKPAAAPAIAVTHELALADIRSKNLEKVRKDVRLTYYDKLKSPPTMAIAEQLSFAEEPEKEVARPTPDEKSQSTDRLAQALAKVLGKETPEPVKQVAQDALPSATGSRFAVQVASAPDRAKAEQYLRFLENRGYEVRLVQATVGDTTTYRVRLHGFGTREQAEAARKQFEQKEGRLALTVAQ